MRSTSERSGKICLDLRIDVDLLCACCTLELGSAWDIGKMVKSTAVSIEIDL